MANEEHLRILRSGVEAWHEWTRKNRGKRFDLRGADLRDIKLDDADLDGTELSSAKLNGAVLRKASLSNVDLSNADLRGADLSHHDRRATSFSHILQVAEVGRLKSYS